jgi:hypothetical protein
MFSQVAATNIKRPTIKHILKINRQQPPFNQTLKIRADQKNLCLFVILDLFSLDLAGFKPAHL